MVPQPPGRHLDGNPLCRCKCLCIKALYVAGDAVAGCLLADKGFVCVAFCAPQTKVAVGNGKRPAFLTDLFHKAHRINASADCNQEH